MKSINPIILCLAVLPLFLSTVVQSANNSDWRYPAEWNCKIVTGNFYPLNNGSIVSTSDGGVVNCPIYTVIPENITHDYYLDKVYVRIIEEAGQRSYCRVYHSSYNGDNIRSGRNISSHANVGSVSLDLSPSILNHAGRGFHAADGNYSIFCVIRKGDRLVNYRATMSEH